MIRHRYNFNQWILSKICRDKKKQLSCEDDITHTHFFQSNSRIIDDNYFFFKFLHSVSRKLESATHRARLPAKEKKN